MSGGHDEALAGLAGDYECGGNYIHRTIRVRPDGRYTASVSECLGDHVTVGTAELTKGHMVLRPDAPSLWSQGDSPLLPVGWGDRLYLIPVSQLPGFCYDA